MVEREFAVSGGSETRAVVLIGFMGAGKTSVGRVLTERLGWLFEDLDDRIERLDARKIAEIFRDSGEPAFRRVEHIALKEALAELQQGAHKVMALGGGAFAQKRNARLIEAAGVPTVFLEADIKELWRRCQKQCTREGIQRPLLGTLESFLERYEARQPHYVKASVRLNANGKTVKQIAAEVIKILRLDRRLDRQSGRRGKSK
jgi:shikimate kinase